MIEMLNELHIIRDQDLNHSETRTFVMEILL